jgi:tryptophan synthase alpha chain
MRRIGKKFLELERTGAKAFIPFIVAGDPDLETTVQLVPELERAGSDIIELGIPFSDPVADGPTIQRAGSRALRHQYRIGDYLQAVKTIRKSSGVPLLLFSYFNPVLQYGLDALARDARAAGIDGILVTDMTPEESDQYSASMEANELDCIFLVAPTSSEERIAKITACSRGFVYIVSRTGVTGAQQDLSGSVSRTVVRVRKCTSLPVAVGFGISRPEHVRAIWEIADGAVVGSAIVSEMEKVKNPHDLPRQIAHFCLWLTGRTGRSPQSPKP